MVWTEVAENEEAVAEKQPHTKQEDPPPKGREQGGRNLSCALESAGL